MEMRKVCWALNLFMVSLIIHQTANVQGLIYGTPVENCRSMLPQHDRFLPQIDPAPYNFTATMISGNRSDSPVKFNVSLSGQRTATFKGFFIQARMSDLSDAIIGSFDVVKSDQFRFIDCPGGVNNAATHVFNKPKRSVSFLWSPPANFEGRFYFVATVVQEYKTIWIGLETPSFKLTKAGDLSD